MLILGVAGLVLREPDLGLGALAVAVSSALGGVSDLASLCADLVEELPGCVGLETGDGQVFVL